MCVPFLSLLALLLQDPLFPSPRLETVVAGELVDLDGDGRDDLLSSVGVWLSDGSFGVEAVPLPSFPPDVVADFDGDGDLDVAGEGADDEVRVGLFDPVSRSFTEVAWPFVHKFYALVGGDVDGDGNVDLFHPESMGSSTAYAVQLGDGAGGAAGHVGGDFGIPIAEPALGDLDGDGRDDLVFWSGNPPDGLRVSLAIGHGALGSPAHYFPGWTVHEFELADLDLDGDLDAAATSAVDVWTFLGDGTGGLVAGDTAAVQQVYPPLLEVADLDSSGSMEVLVRLDDGIGRTLLALTVDASGAFAAVEEIGIPVPEPEVVLAGDPDGDGDVDLVVREQHEGFGLGVNGMIFLEREGDALLQPELLAALPADEPWDTMTVGDVDQDGDDDVLIVAGSEAFAAQATLLRNDGAGGLATVPGPAVLPGVAQITLADVAGDGTLDLLGFQAGAGAQGMMIAAGDGQGGFGAPVSHPFSGAGTEVAVADWTGDGLVDLVAPGFAGLAAYHGKPAYAFDPAPTITLPSSLYLDVVPADLDLDGELDVVTRNGTSLLLALADGAGGYTEVQTLVIGPVPDSGKGLASGDFDADGLADVVITIGRWYRGVGGGQVALVGDPYALAQQDEHVVTDVTVRDVNADGVDDAVIHNGAVLLGGPAGLAHDRSYHSGGVSRVAVGELTGDGVLDLVVEREDTGYVLLRGLSGPGCAGAFEAYGAGCAGGAGVPVLAGSGCPTPGGAYALEVTGGPPSTVAYASFGLGQGAVPLPNGCTLLLDPWIPVFVGFSLDGAGVGSLGIAVSPASPVGVTYTAQVGLFDPNAPGFFTLTNGLATTVE